MATILIGLSVSFFLFSCKKIMKSMFKFAATLMFAVVAFSLVTVSNVGAATNPAPKGFLDVANYVTIEGWACDPSDYRDHIQVHIYVDGNFYRATTADRVREQAVANECGGYDMHGFLVYGDGLPVDQKSHVIRAYAINTPVGSNPELNQSPKTINPLPGVAISFNKNDSSATGSMGPQWIAKGVGASLKANTFVKPGWSLWGWALTPGGTPVVLDQGCYVPGPSVPYAFPKCRGYVGVPNNATLYAVWQPNR